VNSFVQDLRFALRQLRKSPGFTAVVVITLALGIGANTAIFTVVEAVLLRSLPYPHPEKIVELADYNAKRAAHAGTIGVPRIIDVHEQNRVFDGVAYYFFENATLSLDGRLPERIKGDAVSGDFWRVMDVQPLLGSTFGKEGDLPNSPNEAVISYGLWQRVFGGDRDIVGRQVTIGGKTTTIVGVMPSTFNYPRATELWTTTHFPLDQIKFRSDGSRFMGALARIKPDVDFQAAQNDLNLIATRLAQQYPQTDADWQFRLVPLRESLVGSIRPALIVLMTAVGFVLLIACANVANLLLSRAVSRQREIAMRQALGAGNWRLIRQLLTESTLLALLGGLVGIALVAPFVHFLVSKLPAGMVQPDSVHVNAAVLLFTFSICVLTGVLFGLAPSFALTGPDLRETLKQNEAGVTAHGNRWTRSALVAAEVGLSVVLLAGAGLLIETFWRLQRVDLGFQPDHVLTFEISFPWGTNPKLIHHFYNDVLQRVQSLPGVAAAGTIQRRPLDPYSYSSAYWIEGQPRPAGGGNIVAENRSTSGNYFGAMGIPVIAGRTFTEQDTQSAGPNQALLLPVGIINKAIADRYFPNENSIGKHLLSDSGPVEIVGIVGNNRGNTGDLQTDPVPMLYVPEQGWPMDVFTVRTRSDPATLVTAIREQVRQIDPNKAIYNVQTMERVVDDAVAQPRLNMFLLATFAALALVLASVGLYGVTAYLVAERTREIGVRMALGARREQILQLFLARGARWAIVGGLGGLIAAFVLVRFLHSLLFEVAPYDPLVFAGVTILLGIIVIAACYVPARRAASIDPMKALRYE
jgi:putative ABC transport system permease protein